MPCSPPPYRAKVSLSCRMVQYIRNTLETIQCSASVIVVELNDICLAQFRNWLDPHPVHLQCDLQPLKVLLRVFDICRSDQLSSMEVVIIKNV